MSRNLFYKVMRDLFSFFWFLRETERKRIVQAIPVYALKGDRLYEADTIPVSRPIGMEYAKSLHRPVARNDIKQCSRIKAGAGNKNVLFLYTFYYQNKK